MLSLACVQLWKGKGIKLFCDIMCAVGCLLPLLEYNIIIELVIQSYISKGIWRQGIGSFVRNFLCFSTMPCRHMPLLVHFWVIRVALRGLLRRRPGDVEAAGDGDWEPCFFGCMFNILNVVNLFGCLVVWLFILVILFGYFVGALFGNRCSVSLFVY